METKTTRMFLKRSSIRFFWVSMREDGDMVCDIPLLQLEETEMRCSALQKKPIGDRNRAYLDEGENRIIQL